MATLTARGRETRALALSRRVQRQHAHDDAFNHGASKSAPARDVTVWAAHGAIVFPHEAFAASDYGQLCQRLGLSPSRPRKAAA